MKTCMDRINDVLSMRRSNYYYNYYPLVLFTFVSHWLDEKLFYGIVYTTKSADYDSLFCSNW